MVGVIGAIVFIGMGILCRVSPKNMTRADKRDDPEAVEQIRKAGYVFIAIGIGVFLLVLKYTH